MSLCRRLLAFFSVSWQHVFLCAFDYQRKVEKLLIVDFVLEYSIIKEQRVIAEIHVDMTLGVISTSPMWQNSSTNALM